MSAISNRPNAYPSLVEALRLLPDIRPVYERHRLGEAKHEASRARSRTASVTGVSVTLLELEELFADGEGGIPRVSPTGAALLLRLFSEGAFDFADSGPVEGGLELLTQYSQGQASLINSRFWGKIADTCHLYRPGESRGHNEQRSRKSRSCVPVLAPTSLCIDSSRGRFAACG